MKVSDIAWIFIQDKTHLEKKINVPVNMVDIEIDDIGRS